MTQKSQEGDADQDGRSRNLPAEGGADSRDETRGVLTFAGSSKGRITETCLHWETSKDGAPTNQRDIQRQRGKLRRS